MDQSSELIGTIPRPSSARYHGVSHIFSKHFGDTFQRDAIEPEKVKNLETSRGSRDTYHEKYVADLIKVTEERRARLQKCNELEKSIMHAQAKALMTEQRELARLEARLGTKVEQPKEETASVGGEKVEDSSRPSEPQKTATKVTLPPRSYLRDTLDSRLLQENGLLCPLDVTRRMPPPVPPPKSRKMATESQGATGGIRSASSKSQSSAQRSGSAPHRSRSVNSNLNSLALDDVLDEEDLLDFSRCASECSQDGKRQLASSKSMQILLPPIASKTTRNGKTDNDVSVCWGIPANWRDHMNGEQREKTRRRLAVMHGRVNFLKNPRFALPWEENANGLLIGPVAKTPVIFDVRPNPVLFTDYKSNHVYEIRVQVKNVTAAMRPVRVIPPATSHFSVGLGQFPGEKGLIAPGLWCEYAVRFAPDSLGDFIDQLVLETQDKDRGVVVPLLAQRKRPCLTVSDVWDIGACLVDGQKIVHWHVKNTGGPGRFVLMSEDAWPKTNFQVAVRSGIMVAEPFVVYPEYMELGEGDTGTFNIVFIPQQVGVFERRFHMLCDNCHMRTFTLRGVSEVASLELIANPDGDVMDDWAPGEVHDVTAQSVLRFGQQHPFTIRSRKILVKNNCHVNIPFVWKVVKPLFSDNKHLNWSEGSEDENEGDDDKQPQEGQGDSQAPILRHRILDVSSPFSVDPPQGVLKGDAVTLFTILFAPTEVSSFISSLHLVMKDIPDSLPASVAANFLTNSGAASINPFNSAFVESVNGLPSGGNASPDNAAASQQRVMILSDVPELEVEARGTCIPLQATLHPAAVVITGKILLGTPTRRTITLTNCSTCPISFYWQEFFPSASNESRKDSTDTNFSAEDVEGTHGEATMKQQPPNRAILEVQPSFGQLAACDDPYASNSINLDVCITGVAVGSVRTNLCCYIEHMESPLFLPVEAVIKGPELLLEEPNLNFGLVRVGHSRALLLHIRNPSSVACAWTLHLACDRDPGLMEEFTFSRVDGSLRALEMQEVTVVYTPRSATNVDTELELHTGHGDVKCIQVTAIGQTPNVALEKCRLTPPDLFYRMTARHPITLSNQTAMEAAFHWLPAMGHDATEVQVRVTPDQGVLAPREKRVLEVSITPNALIDLQELLVPCVVDGQEEPVILSIEGPVKDLSVELALSHEAPSKNASAPLPLDSRSPLVAFGENIPLWSVVTRYLHIRNPTSIPTTFHLTVEYFQTPKVLQGKSPATVHEMSSMPPCMLITSREEPGTDERGHTTRPTEEAEEEDKDEHEAMEKQSSKKSLLKKTPNLADPRSKPAKLAHYDYCKRMLGEKKGLAFHCFPRSGELPPYSTVVVEINAFNDMWGDYRDRLLCQVGYLPPLPIDLTMSVVGCPVEFTMTAGREGHQPVVRFGSHTAGSRDITRPVRLNNKSPFWLRIDWEMYEMQPQDTKLLDLCVGFGQVFPLLDASGEEIPPGGKPKTETQLPSAKSLSAPLSNSPDSTEMGVETGRTESSEGGVAHLMPPPFLGGAGFFSSEASASHFEDGMETLRTELDVPLHEHGLHTTQRPKLIHLFVRPHEGVITKPEPPRGNSTSMNQLVTSPRNCGFTVTPKQLMLPPESYAMVQASFHPTYDCPWREAALEEQKKQRGGLTTSTLPIEGYALGFISVDEERAHVGGKCHRMEQYHVEQVRLELTGSIDEPELEVTNEEEDEGHFAIEGSLSELLPNNWRELDQDQMQRAKTQLFPSSTSNLNSLSSRPANVKPKTVVKTCHGLLRNYKETNLSFELSCPPPFRLIRPAPNQLAQHNSTSPADAATGEPTKVTLQLKPRETCQLEMAFHITPQLLETLLQAPDYREDETQPCYRRSLCTSGPVLESELCLQDAFSIRFSNNRMQYQGISAKIRFPAFHLTKNMCDFGYCFISQTREQQLYIKNPTSSNCVWRVTAATNKANEGIFRIEPDHGLLENSDVCTNKSKTLLRIFFTPKDQVSYQITYTFHGILGELPQTLTVSGTGSYDGQYHEVYNE